MSCGDREMRYANEQPSGHSGAMDLVIIQRALGMTVGRRRGLRDLHAHSQWFLAQEIQLSTPTFYPPGVI